MDAKNNKQTSGHDISWCLLHFKQHVQASLHTDIELALQQYSPIQRGDPLYFSILMGQLFFSNEQSCEALVSLVQAYNIATDGKDDLLAVIKLLCSATKSIILMCSDKAVVVNRFLISTSSICSRSFKLLAWQISLIELDSMTINLNSNDSKAVIVQTVLKFSVMCPSFY